MKLQTRDSGTEMNATSQPATGACTASLSAGHHAKLRRRARFQNVAAIAVVTVVGGLGLSKAHAAQDVFTGGTEWTLAGGWSTGSVPGSGDNIVINSASPTNGTYTLTSDAMTVEDIAFSLGTPTTLTGNTSASTLTLNDGRGAGVPLIDVNSTKTLTIQNATAPATLGLVLGASGALEIDNSGSLTISSNITQTGGSQALTISGAGSGVVTLSGTDSFSGGLVVTGAEVDVTGDSSLGATGGGITINGGRLGFQTNNTTIGSTRPFLLGANPTGSNTSGTLSIKGSIIVGYAGVIQDLNGSTHGDLVKQGGGTLQLGGVSTYSGNTFINNGTVQLTTGGDLPSTTVLNIGQANSTNVGIFDLNGVSQQIAGLSSITGTNGSGSANNTVTSSSGTPTLTINTASGTVYSFGNAVGNTNALEANPGVIAGSVALIKTGLGTQFLGNGKTASSYSGGTTVSQGTLVVNSQLSSGLTVLGSGPVSVANGATLDYAATTTGVKLDLSSTLSLASGSTIGCSIGSGVTGSEILATGKGSATGPVTVNIFGVGGTPTTNTYTLIAAATGGTLSSASYSLGTVYNNTNFTVGAPTASTTTVSIPVTVATALPNEYWTGGLSGATSVWAASNGSTASNWVSAPTGGATALVPGSTANVFISANTVVTAPGNSGSTTLGADVSIGTLTISDTTNGLTLNADGNALTINAAGGITMASSVPASAIATPIYLAASQTWTNNSSHSLTASGTIEGGSGSALNTAGTGTIILSGQNEFAGNLNIGSGNTLQIGGAGTLGTGTYAGTISLTGTLEYSSSANQTLSGGISGTGGLTKDSSSAGILILSGTNGIQGTTAINAGILQLGSASALGGIGSITFGGGTLQYTSASATGNDLSTYLVNSTAAPIALDTNGQNVTLAGTINNTNTHGLTKLGFGNLILSGNNTFSGTTTVSAGNLYLNGTNANTPTISVASGATLGGTGSASTATATVASGGIIEAGSSGAGTLTLAGLTFTGAGTINISNISNYPSTGSTAGVNVTGSNGLNVGNTTGAISLSLIGPAPSGSGTVHMLEYSGTVQGSAGTGAFAISTAFMTGAGGRASFVVDSLSSDPGFVDVTYGIDHPVWNGNVGGGVWDTGTAVNTGGTFNWTSATYFTATNFIAGDTPVFNDNAIGTTNVAIAAAGVSPGIVTFSNLNKSYTLSSSGSTGITGLASVTVSGGGLVTFTNTNTYTGGTTVSNGTLSISADNNLGSSTGTLALQTGGVLSLSASVTNTSRTITIGTGGGTVATNGNNFANAGTTNINDVLSTTNISTGTGNVLLSGTVTFGTNGALSVGSGTSVTLQPTNATVTMANGGTIYGNLILNSASRFNFDNGNFLGSGSIQVQATGATLTNSSTAFGSGTINNPLNLNSASIAFTKGDVTQSPYVAGNFITTLGGTNSPNAASPITFSGVISGNSDLNIGNNATTGGGGGAVVLGNGGTHETYTGTTTINNSGVITLENANVLPTSTDVIVGTETGIGAATLDLNGFSQQIGSISDGTNVTASAHTLTITNGRSPAATLTVGDSTTPAKSFSGPINDGAGTIALVKTGSDSITLAGGNRNYSGGTTVNNGTLLVTGSPTVNGSSVITLSSTGLGGVTVNGGRLGGTGTVGNGTSNLSLAGPYGADGVVSINAGAIISPGKTTLTDFTSTGVGTLTTGDMTWNGGTPASNSGAYYFKTNVATGSSGTQASSITAGTQDLVVSNGTLNVVTNSGTFILNLVFSGSLTGNFIVANAQSIEVNGSNAGLTPIVGSPVALSALTIEDNGTPDPSETAEVIADGSSSGYDIVVVTPEPGSLGLLGLASLGLLRRSRRRSLMGRKA